MSVIADIMERHAQWKQNHAERQQLSQRVSELKKSMTHSHLGGHLGSHLTEASCGLASVSMARVSKTKRKGRLFGSIVEGSVSKMWGKVGFRRRSGLPKAPHLGKAVHHDPEAAPSAAAAEAQAPGMKPQTADAGKSVSFAGESSDGRAATSVSHSARGSVVRRLNLEAAPLGEEDQGGPVIDALRLPRVTSVSTCGRDELDADLRPYAV